MSGVASPQLSVKTQQEGLDAMSTTFMTLLFTATMMTGVIHAQTAAKAWPDGGLGAYNYLYRGGLVCGGGASHSDVRTNPTVQCGAVLSMPPFFDLEFGVMGPQANRSNISGYLSTNFVAPLPSTKRFTKTIGMPIAICGYTRMFETGHALDYGVALARPIDSSRSVQFEARDYVAFATPTQHNVVLRVAWIVGVPD